MVLKDANQERKLDHLRIVLEKDVEGPLTTMLEYVFIPHQAAPGVGPEDVELDTEFLGKRLKAPIVISGMTGGAPGTERINRALAAVAREFGLAMGIGSQRAALENPSLTYTYRVVREEAPEAPIIGNIGAAEVMKYPTEKVEAAVSMIEADALAIHLNLAQEAAQPEGTPSFKGILSRVLELKDRLQVPIIIKEVGNGLSYEVALSFAREGINHFDTQGSGGTNWVLVEKYRARESGDAVKEAVATNLLDWGIPTAASVIEVWNAAPHAVIIGSGGVRTAHDAVKLLRLGASLVGMARPFLVAYEKGTLKEFTEGFIQALRMALMMAGARNVDELRERPVILTSLLKQWVEARNLVLPGEKSPCL